ncbi:MAG: hypothetical protein BWY63_03177 [Chloroflexi bacterium ADurb.Bin360]|nr:MAG: hypothetical protein BWY63_03177 [Chloroflexi bacterium ADurb.Bin360]
MLHTRRGYCACHGDGRPGFSAGRQIQRPQIIEKPPIAPTAKDQHAVLGLIVYGCVPAPGAGTLPAGKELRPGFCTGGRQIQSPDIIEIVVEAVPTEDNHSAVDSVENHGVLRSRCGPGTGRVEFCPTVVRRGRNVQRPHVVEELASVVATEDDNATVRNIQDACVSQPDKGQIPNHRWVPGGGSCFRYGDIGHGFNLGFSERDFGLLLYCCRRCCRGGC